MLNYIGCLIAFGISLLLSTFDFIGDRETKILTTLGWVTALYFAKGGACD